MMNMQHVAKMAEGQKYFPRSVAEVVRGWLLFQARGHPQPTGQPAGHLPAGDRTVPTLSPTDEGGCLSSQSKGFGDGK